MASASRTLRKKSTPAQVILSDVHAGRPCSKCFLCKETQVVYTHPIKWKNQLLLTFLKDVDPELNVQGDTCICRNCRDNLACGNKDPTNFHPRWKKQSTSSLDSTSCEVPECNEPACRSTKLGSNELISQLFNFSPADPTQTSLCSKHYRVLHKEINPSHYQWTCAVCSSSIKASSYRTCTKPEIFQCHLKAHTDYLGTITATEKLCMACYRYSLAVVKQEKEKPISTDTEFNSVVTAIQNSIPMLPFTISEESELIDLALTLTVISVAHDLQKDHALTLPCAHSRFICNIDKLLLMCSFPSPPKLGTPRWLLAQLSTQLKHHMSYTCIVKKHGIILYRQGRELQCLSHALFTARSTNYDSKMKDKSKGVLKTLNSKIHKLIEGILALPTTSLSSFNLNLMVETIKKIDSDIWDAICILTDGASDDKCDESEASALVKQTRRLFILHQIMFLMDKRCTQPFHILNADLIDCYGGSSELIKIFNRLGVCASEDTLKRHIQSAIQAMEEKGMLLGLNPASLIIFTLDNIDFLCSHAQVYCGNQNLSWHGTTVQAVHTKPSLDKVNLGNRPRSHALLSPLNSLDKEEHSPAPKRLRCRARTENELKSKAGSIPTASYDFQSMVVPSSEEPVLSITLSEFRPSYSERASVSKFLTQAFTYCLIKNALPIDKQKEFVSLQEFVGISANVSTPEVGQVKYILVLDEIADNKDTILHVVSDLYTRYMISNDHKFLVLVGDAKVYDVIQILKFEYGSDLDWLIAFPGDWHFLKNYQLCLMKPFFEAGLKDLATATGYSASSIQKCSIFERVNHFLIETWESLFRHMLQTFLSQHRDAFNLSHTIEELEKHQYDRMAAYCVIQSLQEEMLEFEIEKKFREYIGKMSAKDDTWAFWEGFLFADCLAYLGLLFALRSEDWHLRMASLKSMAVDFTAWDHPTYQKLLTQHIVDVFNMPEDLLQHLKKGSFTLSISGNVMHSVGLDECHEMLINKDVKESVVRPSEEYINRIAKYIPFRVTSKERFKSQIFASQTHKESVNSVIFSKLSSNAKAEVNIQRQLEKINDVELLPANLSSNRGLINPFRNLVADQAQKQDLLHFRQVGSYLFENRVKAYVLKEPSVKVPMKRKQLQTFCSKQKKSSKKATSLEKEMKRVQKCMRRKIAYALNNNINLNVMGEQYIEVPRALCDVNNLPIKGQKSLVTKFYQNRYKSATLISHSLPNNWIPDCVILEGMFLIYTKPLHIHKIMADYGNFLIKKFVLPHFRKGSKELHLLFDNTTGQQDSPKLFEQERRDTTMTDHQCVVFFDEAAVPTKWQQTINFRTCKGQLTSFLSTYIIQNIGPHLHDSQKYVTSGGMGTQVGKEVTRSGVSEPSVYKSDAPESDTRLWLHAKHSAGPKKFILSPDTDVYHIGMPLISADERIMVQLNRPSDKETKILDLTLLVDVLKSDPDLCHIPDDDIPLTIQALFVSTGCDYTSFFSGIGKAFFLQVFLDQSTFIVGSHPGHFSANFGSTTLSSQAQESELAFIRLVGCAYIKKHSNAFYGKTPQSLLHSFASASSPTEQHSQWLDHIRQGIWDRISLESESIPSFSALQLHWRRSCWVLHMWQQALSHSMELASLEGNGWKKAANGKLTVHWETEENMKKVKERVLLLMSGCGCKSGCKNMRCGCKRKSMSCGPGCRCTDCCNQETPPPTTLDNTERISLEEEVNDVMNCVFGIEEASYDAEEDSSEEENVNSDSEDSELLQDCLQK